MTNNQVAYWNYKELVRSNRAKEAETQRSNQVREEETARANRAQEKIAYDRYLEEARANRANESIKWGQLGEQRRANLVSERQKESQVLLWNAETGLTSQKTYTEEANTSRQWVGYDVDVSTSILKKKEVDWYDRRATADVVDTWANAANKGLKGISDSVKTFTMILAQ